MGHGWAGQQDDSSTGNTIWGKNGTIWNKDWTQQRRARELDKDNYSVTVFQMFNEIM